MTGGALLDRIAAAGASASLDLDGQVRIAGASRLPAGLLDLLRQNRAEIADALAQREADRGDAAERAAMAEHCAAPPDPRPWRPGDPDPLAAGLLAGWRGSRSDRLLALAERLEATRPRRTWGTTARHWQELHAAAREAAVLPSAEWAAWRASLVTEATWPTDRGSSPQAADARR